MTPLTRQKLVDKLQKAYMKVTSSASKVVCMSDQEVEELLEMLTKGRNR